MCRDSILILLSQAGNNSAAPIGAAFACAPMRSIVLVIRLYSWYTLAQSKMEDKGGTMVIVYIWENSKHFDLTNGKKYNVIEISRHGLYRIVDYSGDDYLYPPDMFEVVSSTNPNI